MTTQGCIKVRKSLFCSYLPEMTSRFQSATPAGQRCILQYMLPWLANIELVDLANPPSLPNMEVELDEEKEGQSEVLLPIDLNGDGWGSVEATRLVLNNLFYITVKVCTVSITVGIDGWMNWLID